MNELLVTVILGAGFLLIFALGELMYHGLHLPTEITRKFVHLSSGLLTLTFPLWLSVHWYVLALCSLFALILIASQKYDFLKSINKVNRITRGSYLFPASVYGSYLLFSYYNDLLFFFLPILILAISDPLAALFGKRFPFGKFKVGKEHKTMIGSGAFLVSALIISVILFSLQGNLSGIEISAFSFGISFVSCSAEAMSRNGWDNISIPLSVAATYFIFSIYL
jgi:phytol kinase